MKDVSIEDNEWHPLCDLDRVIEVLKDLAEPDPHGKDGSEIPGLRYWTWIKNTKCKYVSIRIDMRDGGFVLLDRGGKRVLLKDIEHQAKWGGPVTPTQEQKSLAYQPIRRERGY
jgi:hypothetical protein